MKYKIGDIVEITNPSISKGKALFKIIGENKCNSLKSIKLGMDSGWCLLDSFGDKIRLIE